MFRPVSIGKPRDWYPSAFASARVVVVHPQVHSETHSGFSSTPAIAQQGIRKRPKNENCATNVSGWGLGAEIAQQK